MQRTLKGDKGASGDAKLNYDVILLLIVFIYRINLLVNNYELIDVRLSGCFVIA